MDPAHHHGFSPFPELFCDLVGSRRIAGHDGEADHVAWIVEIDVLNGFIDQIHVPRVRRVGCNGRKTQFRKPDGSPLRRRQMVSAVARIRIDQQKPLASRGLQQLALS